jgi:DNA-directed RNA polymerase alpha subunit
MYHPSGVLDEYLTRELNKMSEPDCEAAIKILRQRLKFLHSSDYYLMISVDDLQFSKRAFDVLKVNKLETVKDIMEFGWENIGMLRNTGPYTLNEIKNKIEWIIAHKNEVREMAGSQLGKLIADKRNLQLLLHDK